MASSLSAEDKIAIIELLGDYAYRLDSGDIDGYVDNFLPDGTFEDFSGKREGRDAIRASVGGMMEAGRVGGNSRVRHVLGIPHIQGEGDRARTRTYVLMPRQNDEKQVSFPNVGVYEDELVKKDGRWRIAHRTVRIDLG